MMCVIMEEMKTTRDITKVKTSPNCYLGMMKKFQNE